MAEPHATGTPPTSGVGENASGGANHVDSHRAVLPGPLPPPATRRFAARGRGALARRRGVVFPRGPSKQGAARGAGCTAPAPHRPSAPLVAALGHHNGRAAALGGLWGLGGTRASTVSGSSPPPAHAPCTSEPASRPFPAGLDQALTLGAVAGAPPVGKGTRPSALSGPHFLRRVGQMAAAALWAESAAPPEMCGVRKAQRRGFLRGAASPAPPSRVGGGGRRVPNLRSPARAFYATRHKTTAFIGS